MTSLEAGKPYQLPELASPSVDVIRDLKSRRIIRDGSPFWWSTDYAPDPREFVPFDEFQRRLVNFGDTRTLRTEIAREKTSLVRAVALYPNPTVPISIVNLPVDGQHLPFMVTARPFNKKEALFSPDPKSLHSNHTLEELIEGVKDGSPIDLPDHFYPHVRGLFAGRRGNHFFWYMLEPYPTEDLQEDFSVEPFKKIKKGLSLIGLENLGIYRETYSDTRSYRGVWDEITKRTDLLDVRGGPRWQDFSEKEVSAEEFIDEYETSPNLLVYYPLRTPDFKFTLPLAITNTTNKGATNRKPAILGVFADNGMVGRNRHRGIFRLRNKEFAQAMAKAITSDFGIPVDAVLFTPQKGKPKYERISA